MKTMLVFLAITLTITIFSCSDNSVSTNSSTYPISGKISNWNGRSGKLLALAMDSTYTHGAIVDSCIISSDGSFSLNLKSPPSQYLSGISFTNTSNCSGNIIVNPANARISLLELVVYDSVRNHMGIISKRSTDSSIVNGSFNIDHIYCDRQVTMNGTRVCTGGQDTTFYNFAWSGVNNWNILVSTFTVNAGGFISSETYTVNEPSGASWYFISTPGETTKERVLR